MKHIVAFDVSMGKSTMVIYDRYRRCEFEATGVYSKALEQFFQKEGYVYCRINPLEANL